MSDPKALLIIVMGTAGSGKSTVGRLLASKLRYPFLDGDDLHPAANIAKQTRGEPLTDEDRMPWFDIILSRAVEATASSVANELHDPTVSGGRVHSDSGGRPGVVIASSALKKSYRDYLRTSRPELETRFVYLKGSPELLLQRMTARQGHFMKEGMLKSQLATLEEPNDEAGVAIVSIDNEPEKIAEEATKVVEL
ncbi:carbohydrate kinase [Atractiella rhizophila]|nr:carbohydrate kinase [Atractiella rhizophila]